MPIEGHDAPYHAAARAAACAAVRGAGVLVGSNHYFQGRRWRCTRAVSDHPQHRAHPLLRRGADRVRSPCRRDRRRCLRAPLSPAGAAAGRGDRGDAAARAQREGGGRDRADERRQPGADRDRGALVRPRRQGSGARRARCSPPRSTRGRRRSTRTASRKRRGSSRHGAAQRENVRLYRPLALGIGVLGGGILLVAGVLFLRLARERERMAARTNAGPVTKRTARGRGRLLRDPAGLHRDPPGHPSRA